MKVASEPWSGSVRLEPGADLAFLQHLLEQRSYCALVAELLEHDDEGVVADDGVLDLQVVA